MIVIKCKSGVSFFGANDKFNKAELKLQIAYYKAQGCIVEEQETSQFGECGCKHCQELEHEFDDLIEEIKNEDSF